MWECVPASDWATFWLSRLLGAKLHVCIPAESELAGLPLRQPVGGCNASETIDVQAAKAIHARRALRGGGQSYVLRGERFALLSMDSRNIRADGKAWFKALSAGEWRVLHGREVLIISSHKGLMQRAWLASLNSKGSLPALRPFGDWLRSAFSSPWQPLGTALRAVVDLTPPRLPPTSTKADATDGALPPVCLHIRTAHLYAPLGDLLECASSDPDALASGVHVFSDLGSDHLRSDRSASAGDTGALQSPFSLAARSYDDDNVSKEELLRRMVLSKRTLREIVWRAATTRGQLEKAKHVLRYSDHRRTQALRKHAQRSSSLELGAGGGAHNDSLAGDGGSVHRAMSARALPTAAWLQLARCGRTYYTSLSTFSLTAAAAAGATRVYTSPGRYVAPFATCDEAYVPWEDLPSAVMVY
jgi:hypothetical protein